MTTESVFLELKKDLNTEIPYQEEEELSEEVKRAERGHVWRLDIFMLIIGFLGYCMKNLDVRHTLPTPL